MNSGSVLAGSVGGTTSTSDVLPAVPMSNVLREDEPAASLSPEEALRNAPGQARDCFQVPRVIE